MPGTGGYSTTGFPIATMASLAEGQLISVDTQNPNGSSPQTIAVPIGLIGAQMNLGSAAVTARAGGGQANATQLEYGISNVTVVATAADSVKLPPAIPGSYCYVRNSDAADSMTVFGYGTDTIDGVASATGNAQAAGKGKLYFCISGNGSLTGAGAWVSLLGA